MNQTCSYHLRPGNVPCGAEANHKNFTGAKYMYLCAAHAVQVQRATRGQCRPEPLGESDWLTIQIPQMDPAGRPAAPERTGLSASPAAVPPARGNDFAERLRRFREELAGRGEVGAL